jgi:hypothetical protein
VKLAPKVPLGMLRGRTSSGVYTMNWRERMKTLETRNEN